MASGVAELACAAGMLVPATRRAAGWASVAVLVGVFPGNVTMAQKAMRRGSPAVRAASLARLPLQLPLVRIAWRVGRGR